MMSPNFNNQCLILKHGRGLLYGTRTNSNASMKPKEFVKFNESVHVVDNAT
jgi:hypothetical protein